MKRTTLALTALFAALFALPIAAHADAASKRAKIEEMIRLTKMDESMAKLMDQTKGEISDMVNEQRDGAAGLPPNQAAIMNDFENKVSKLMLDKLNPDEIHPLVVKLYDDSYTEDELDGILAFYKTPAGQALLSKSSDLMDKIVGMVQQRIVGLGPQIEKLSDDMQKQMAATKPATPTSPPNIAAPDNTPTPAPPPPPAPKP